MQKIFPRVCLTNIRKFPRGSTKYFNLSSNTTSNFNKSTSFYKDQKMSFATDSEEINDKTKFYDLLEIGKEAHSEEIKKAFKKQVHICLNEKHFDQGEHEKLQIAYETLSDPVKRRIYDKFGIEGLKLCLSADGFEEKGFEASHKYREYFKQNTFDRNYFLGKKRKKDKSNTNLKVLVSLEEMYTGGKKIIEIKRDRQCKSCEGTGAKSGCEEIKCQSCNGKGYKIIVNHAGHMIMQTSLQCFDCDGDGFKLREEDKCNECKGEGVINLKVKKELDIQKGSYKGEIITFKGEGDEIPGVVTRDFTIELIQENHDVFERKGADLISKINLSLSEALSGGIQRELNFLDGRKIIIKTTKGEVIQPGTMKTVHGLGMPFYKAKGHGNLFLYFTVTIPELKPNQLDIVKEALSKGEKKPACNKVNKPDQDLTHDHNDHKKPKIETYIAEPFNQEEENPEYSGGGKKDKESRCISQ